MRPSRPSTSRSGSWYARHQSTSVASPKVQHITAPVPLLGSAAPSASSSTMSPRGVVTRWPTSPA